MQDSREICRVCLNVSKNGVDFSEPFEENAPSSEISEGDFTYFDCFVDVTHLNVDPLEVELPQMLCNKCCRELHKCYSFQKRARAADEKLRQNYLHSKRNSCSEAPLEELVVLSGYSEDCLKSDVDSTSESQENCENSNRSSVISSAILEKNNLSLTEYVFGQKHSEPDGFKSNCVQTANKSPLKLSATETFANLKDHSRIVEEADKYCSICDKTFADNTQFAQHKVSDHNPSLPNFVNKQRNINSAYNKTIDLIHETNSNATVKVECKVCKRKFEPTKYKVHFSKVHSDTPNGYQCPKCPKCFAYRHRLRSHFEIHHELRQKNVPCAMCSKMFYSKKLLRTHMLVHQANEINYNCELCGKGFQRDASLRRHMVMHQGGREQCKECAKRFPNSAELRIHMLTHTKEKAFLCNICGRRFRRQGPLSYHMRKHRGEKYVCEFCGQEFACQSTMRRHEYKHTGLPFKCPRCNGGHITRGSLQRHMKVIHESELTATELREIYNSVQNSRLQ